jgi:uracil-DNA glycosylase
MDPLWRDRGVPWEFDPGPPQNREWSRLFAETPNYRAIGRNATGKEQFRWHFGPMFYRGRLTDGEVKVLVIGQEGAQDESLAHRSFAGGTGARMQHFLAHLGITRSYLFLNTFVYPIFGQYDDELRPLAQGLASLIVLHRHAVLDYLVERNDLRLVVAVGTAAKETVVTWVKAHGGSCGQGAKDVSRCETSVIAPKLKAVGVVHPGAAGKGGSTAAIRADFVKALEKISAWDAQDPAWLPVDQGAVRQAPSVYKYKSAPIPFRDLPYGVAWRIGRGGTSSNRKDNQRGIQLFAAGGKYSTTVPYPTDGAGSKEGYADEPGDLPYEPPRKKFTEYDAGPPPVLARLLMGGDDGFPWPSFAGLGVAHPSLGYGPIYRGRFTGVRLLVVADQESHDDLFTFRALTGDGGQRFQALMAAAGVTRSYLIVRSLPVDTLDLSGTQARAVVDDPKVRALQKEIVARVAASNPLACVLAMGPLARRLVTHVAPSGVPLIELKSARESGFLGSWQSALAGLQQLSFPRDVSNPSFTYGGERGQIPRIDLPYGTLRWQGSSGDRGARATVSGKPSPLYYKILMPKWAFQLPPA